MEVRHDRVAVTFAGSGIAPSVPGAVVPARPIRRREAPLDESPGVARLPVAALEHDGGISGAAAGEVQRPAAEVDGGADLRKPSCIPPLGDSDVHEAVGRERERQEPEQALPSPWRPRLGDIRVHEASSWLPEW